MTDERNRTFCWSYNSTDLRKIVTQGYRAMQQMATTTSSSEVLFRSLSITWNGRNCSYLDRLRNVNEFALLLSTQNGSCCRITTEVMRSGCAAMKTGLMDGIMAQSRNVTEARQVKHLESSQKISSSSRTWSTDLRLKWTYWHQG